MSRQPHPPSSPEKGTSPPAGVEAWTALAGTAQMSPLGHAPCRLPESPGLWGSTSLAFEVQRSYAKGLLIGVGSQTPGRNGLWECLNIKPQRLAMVTEVGHWSSSTTVTTAKEPTSWCPENPQRPVPARQGSKTPR